jgi:hypothetical protein
MALTVVQSGVGGTGNTNLTYPSTGGTVMVSGNMPAFSAYISTSQSISANVFTKIQFDTTEFNLNSNFNTSNYRFTPTVAGYYQVNCQVYMIAGGSTQANTAVYKNGSINKATYLLTAGQQLPLVSAIIYMNGSTDYIEAYGYNNTSGTVYGGGNAPYCYFQAVLVRAA